jgi:hypothetical protein
MVVAVVYYLQTLQRPKSLNLNTKRSYKQNQMLLVQVVYGYYGIPHEHCQQTCGSIFCPIAVAWCLQFRPTFATIS